LFNVGKQFGTSLSTHISNFDDIGQCWIFLCHVLAAILKMADTLKILKAQNCSSNHNTAQIQHCPISTTFHMWVDYGVPNRFPTLIMMSRIYSRNSKLSSGRHFQNGRWICAVLWRPFWKWRAVEFFQCRESIRDIIMYPYIKF
jgi:hypothetical protein